MTKIPVQQPYSSNLNNEKEIDFKSLFEFFIRNKKLISSFSVIFFILGLIYSFTMKKLWQGEFQIVLDASSNTSGLSNRLLGNPIIQNLVGINSLNNRKNIQTEVAILESPSILLPAFEFVNLNYRKSNPKRKDLIFSIWKENFLDVNLKKNTSVLSILYRDTNREIILPVLDKISKDYQIYSKKTRQREIELSENYLGEQISFYKIKSNNSIKKAQDFAIKEDLNINPFNQKSDASGNILLSQYELQNSSLRKDLIPNINIEQERINAANTIRIINLQIAKIEDIGNDHKQLQYIGSTIPGLVNEGLPKALKEIETNLIDLRTKYKEGDKQIQIIIKQRDMLSKLLKERAIGILKAEKLVQEAKMKASTRPKDVILKYKQLIRQADRDEETLINLENALSSLKLEKAKYEDPWELITNPTINPSPLTPGIKKITLISVSIGLIVGSVLALYTEWMTGFIYNRKRLEDILSTKIIHTITKKDLENNNLSKKEQLQRLLEPSNGKITKILLKSNFNKNLIDDFFNPILNNKKDFVVNDLIIDKTKFEQLYLITSLGCIGYKDIVLLNNYLSKFNKTIEGIILIEG